MVCRVFGMTRVLYICIETIMVISGVVNNANATIGLDQFVMSFDYIPITMFLLRFDVVSVWIFNTVFVGILWVCVVVMVVIMMPVVISIVTVVKTVVIINTISIYKTSIIWIVMIIIIVVIVIMLFNRCIRCGMWDSNTATNNCCKNENLDKRKIFSKYANKLKLVVP